MNTDRFDSNEDPEEWDDTAFNMGVTARLMSMPMKSPKMYPPGSHSYNSFRAGWTDEDMRIRSENEGAENNTEVNQDNEPVEIMVHLRHPCFEIDVCPVHRHEDVGLLVRQGYIPLSVLRSIFQ